MSQVEIEALNEKKISSVIISCASGAVSGGENNVLELLVV